MSVYAGVPSVANVPGGNIAGQGAYWLTHPQAAAAALLAARGLSPGNFSQASVGGQLQAVPPGGAPGVYGGTFPGTMPQQAPGQMLPGLAAQAGGAESQSVGGAAAPGGGQGYGGGAESQPASGPYGAAPPVAANPSIMGGLSNQGTYWMTHPQEAADAFLRAHNINPDQHTAMGDWMLQQVQGLLPALFSTYFGAGGQTPTDQLADPNQLLNSIFYGGTGIGANLQNYAGRAMNAFTTSPVMQANLGDAGTQKFLQTLAGLNTYGMNPYMGQAYGNAFDTQMNQQRIAQRNQLFANQPVTSLWDFINQAGQPSAGALGLPGAFPGPPAVGSGGMAAR